MNSKINDIKAQSRATILVKYGDKTIEWVLRPIPPYDLMKHFEVFQNMPKQVKMDTENMSKEDIEFVEKKMLPIMEVLLPACSVDPPVTTKDDDPRIANGEAMHIRDISFGALAELFAKITEMTGLTKEEVEARKNSLQAPSVKP